MTHQNVQLGNLCFFIVTTAFFTCLQDFSQADETKTTQRATQQLSVNPNQTDFEVAVNATPGISAQRTCTSTQ